MKVLKDLTVNYPLFSELKKLVQLFDGTIVAVFFEDYMVNEYFNTLQEFEEWANENII